MGKPVEKFEWRVPHGRDLAPEQKAQLEAQGWAFCQHCGEKHAAFLTHRHLRICPALPPSEP
jgi:hypothetical protein